jgi:cytochrome o ubiquinol oxidase operon protein cyoD
MSDEPQSRNAGDAASGILEAADRSIWRDVLGYLIGLVLAAGLTVASFVVVNGGGAIWGPGIPVALAVFAVAQMGVHLVFFLHLTTAPDNTNTALALAFGVLIVALVIGGSLWIMAHLNHNMMPVHQMMQMQP